MKIERPLTNPQYIEVEATDSNGTKSEQSMLRRSKDSIELIQTPISESIINSTSFYIDKFGRFLELARLSTVHQNFFVIFQLILNSVFFITFALIVIFSWNQIPPEIPFIFQNVEQTWLTISKEYFVINIFIFFLLNLFAYYLLNKSHRINKNNTNVLAFVGNIALMLEVIAIIQIFRLIL